MSVPSGVPKGVRSASDRRQGRLLVGLALIFFGPLGVSFYLYYGHGSWHPGGRVNAGDLIVPPRPLPSLALPLQSSGETDSDFLRRKWTLLYVQQGPCAERCRTSLYETRQVRLALDRDMDRVQRVLIADGDCCDFQFLHEQHPDLIAVRMNPAAAPLLALLPHLTHASPPAPEHCNEADLHEADNRQKKNDRVVHPLRHRGVRIAVANRTGHGDLGKRENQQHDQAGGERRAASRPSPFLSAKKAALISGIEPVVHLQRMPALENCSISTSWRCWLLWSE